MFPGELAQIAGPEGDTASIDPPLAMCVNVVIARVWITSIRPYADFGRMPEHRWIKICRTVSEANLSVKH